MASRHQAEPSPSRTGQNNLINIDQAITRLRANIDATRELASGRIDFDDPRVDSTQKNIRESIREIFGPESPEYYDHSQHIIWHGSQIYLEARSKRQQKFSAGIPHTVDMLEGLISRLQDRRKRPVIEPPAQVRKQGTVSATKQNMTETLDTVLTEFSRHTVTNRICVVHGHGDALKNAVSGYLEKLGLEPVILHKTRDGGRNTMEKIENLPDVDFAIVLLSADDFVQPGKATRNSKPHMHHNVLFELGYYVGRLGKSRVCALYKGQGKPPGDYNGITCLNIDDTSVWRRLLGLELKTAGFEIGEIEE